MTEMRHAVWWAQPERQSSCTWIWCSFEIWIHWRPIGMELDEARTHWKWYTDSLIRFNQWWRLWLPADPRDELWIAMAIDDLPFMHWR